MYIYNIYTHIYLSLSLYIYIYMYDGCQQKPCTSFVYCVHIDMFKGVLFSLCSVPQESRKIPAREAASKTFADACRAVTYV